MKKYEQKRGGRLRKKVRKREGERTHRKEGNRSIVQAVKTSDLAFWG